MKRVKVKILNKLIGNEIPIPKYETKGSAGLDLRACIKDELILKPGKTEMIPMGFAMHLEDDKISSSGCSKIRPWFKTWDSAW